MFRDNEICTNLTKLNENFESKYNEPNYGPLQFFIDFATWIIGIISPSSNIDKVTETALNNNSKSSVSSEIIDSVLTQFALLVQLSVGVLLIILILVCGLIYFFGPKYSKSINDPKWRYQYCLISNGLILISVLLIILIIIHSICLWISLDHFAASLTILCRKLVEIIETLVTKTGCLIHAPIFGVSSRFTRILNDLSRNGTEFIRETAPKAAQSVENLKQNLANFRNDLSATQLAYNQKLPEIHSLRTKLENFGSELRLMSGEWPNRQKFQPEFDKIAAELEEYLILGNHLRKTKAETQQERIQTVTETVKQFVRKVPDPSKITRPMEGMLEKIEQFNLRMDIQLNQTTKFVETVNSTVDDRLIAEIESIDIQYLSNYAPMTILISLIIMVVSSGLILVLAVCHFGVPEFAAKPFERCPKILSADLSKLASIIFCMIFIPGYILSSIFLFTIATTNEQICESLFHDRDYKIYETLSAHLIEDIQLEDGTQLSINLGQALRKCRTGEAALDSLGMQKAVDLPQVKGQLQRLNTFRFADELARIDLTMPQSMNDSILNVTRVLINFTAETTESGLVNSPTHFYRTQKSLAQLSEFVVATGDAKMQSYLKRLAEYEQARHTLAISQHLQQVNRSILKAVSSARQSLVELQQIDHVLQLPDLLQNMKSTIINAKPELLAVLSQIEADLSIEPRCDQLSSIIDQIGVLICDYTLSPLAALWLLLGLLTFVLICIYFLMICCEVESEEVMETPTVESMEIHKSINQSKNQSISQSINRSKSQSISQSINRSITPPPASLPPSRMKTSIIKKRTSTSTTNSGLGAKSRGKLSRGKSIESQTTSETHVGL